MSTLSYGEMHAQCSLKNRIENLSNGNTGRDLCVTVSPVFTEDINHSVYESQISVTDITTCIINNHTHTYISAMNALLAVILQLNL